MNLSRQLSVLENRFRQLANHLSVNRNGSADPIAVFLISLVVVVALFLSALSLSSSSRSIPPADRVRVYCASGVASPINELITAFNQEFGADVEIVRTGGSGQLAGQINADHELGISGTDIYISADEGLMETAQSKGIVIESVSIAIQKPVIAVHVQNDSDIDSLAELVSRNGIRFGVGAKQSAIGRQTRRIAQRSGILARLETRKTTDSENVMTLAQALVVRSLDAAIVWDTVVNQINRLEDSAPGNRANSRPIPLLKIALLLDHSGEFDSHIMIGALKHSKVRDESSKFIDFLKKAPTSHRVFKEFGFSLVDSIPKESTGH